MGHRDLATDSQKPKIVNTVWTSNRAATMHIPGRDPIQTNPALGPSFWKPVKDLDVNVVVSCFEGIEGYLNDTLPGKPSLLDLYLGAIDRFSKGSADHVAWRSTSEYSYTPPIKNTTTSGGLGIIAGASKFRELSERNDIFEGKEFRRGTTAFTADSPTIDDLIKTPEIIEANLPSVLLNPGKMECRLALLQA